jgi:RimJ/RimL family protein N-acetyltransferase
VISSENINLRPSDGDDAERLWRWYNDPEVIRGLSVRYPISLAAERSLLETRTARPLNFFQVRFAIETRDGTHIGQLDLHRTSAEDRSARLGIAIGEKAYWSRGYGADAIRTLLRFGFEQMNLHRIDLTVDADNARAIACYEHVGFRHEGRMRQARYARGAHVDSLVMSILRPEFEPSPGLGGG